MNLNVALSTAVAQGNESQLVPMTAGDTATFSVQTLDGASSKTDDVLGLNSGEPRNFVSGWLVA